MDSIKRCEEYIKNSNKKGGLICDTQPKAEWKWHKLYGEKEDHQKTICRDFKHYNEDRK